MPRKTLPPKIKNLRRYEVNLTQTTEEEIKEHIQSLTKRYEDYFEYINAKQNRMLSKVIEQNPYAGLGFRRPITRLEFDEWTNNDDKCNEMMNFILDFKHDYYTCVAVFEWNEPEIEFMLEKS